MIEPFPALASKRTREESHLERRATEYFGICAKTIHRTEDEDASECAGWVRRGGSGVVSVLEFGNTMLAWVDQAMRTNQIKPVVRINLVLAGLVFASMTLCGSSVSARDLTTAELEHFEKLAFYEANKYRGTIAKFVKPVVFSIHGNPTERDLAILSVAIRDVANNVPHTFRPPGKAEGNLRVIYSDDLKNLIAKDFAPSLEKIFAEGEKMAAELVKIISNENVYCFHIPVVQKGEIIVQYVFMKKISKRICQKNVRLNTL